VDSRQTLVPLSSMPSMDHWRPQSSSNTNVIYMFAEDRLPGLKIGAGTSQSHLISISHSLPQLPSYFCTSFPLHDTKSIPSVTLTSMKLSSSPSGPISTSLNLTASPRHYHHQRYGRHYRRHIVRSRVHQAPYHSSSLTIAPRTSRTSRSLHSPKHERQLEGNTLPPPQHPPRYLPSRRATLSTPLTASSTSLVVNLRPHPGSNSHVHQLTAELQSISSPPQYWNSDGRLLTPCSRTH
jgi:hypothetical protein